MPKVEQPVSITNSFALLSARWDDSSLLALPTPPQAEVIPMSLVCLSCLSRGSALVNISAIWHLSEQ